MKITREALEMAIAAAGDSKMPLILTGRKSVITDVVIDKLYCKFDTWAATFPSELPVGMRRYGKVITKADSELGAGLQPGRRRERLPVPRSGRQRGKY